jgi:putative PIN family toxin of toxin-antitoxin system
VRAVIDTNVWVSGLLWQGPAWRLLRAAEDGHFEICISQALLLELAEVLDYERLQPRLQQLGLTSDHLVAFALGLATPFDVSRSGPPLVAEDPDDDIVLLCAEVAAAAVVVTSDRHLLRLERFGAARILTVDAYLAELN